MNKFETLFKQHRGRHTSKWQHYFRVYDRHLSHLIEDCHTSYWPRFEGGFNSHLNVVEILSKCSHDVNEKWYNLPRTPILQNLDSISFYDSMIVMEKRERVYNRRMVDVDDNGPQIIETV
jgi:hypothetical protein